MIRDRRKGSLLLLLGGAVLAVAGVALAQEWRGLGRVQGVVKNEHGAPLAGARVTLRLDSRPEEGPPPMTTDAKGRWAAIGLAGGRFRLTIEATGYVTVNGWANVNAEGPSPSVPVEMRPLAEVEPGGTEGLGTTIITWLEKANSLLDQGRWAEARELYERSALALPEAERPAVLRSVARTYFLEGKKAESVLALEKALLYGPADEETRRLLTVLAGEVGMAAEVDAFLARLATAGPAPLIAELDPPPTEEEPATAPGAPPEPARAHQTGALQVRFAERNPLGQVAEVAKRWGLTLEQIASVDPAAGRYELADESFALHVPESYRPEEPWGLFVWISPGHTGGVRRPENQQVLAEKKLIWVGANRSSNERPKWTRVSLALDALHNARKLYNIDPRRVYVGGYSGGGRTAAALAMMFPEAVTGAFCFMGVDFYRPIPIPDRPGTHWPAAFLEPPRSVLRRVKEEMRFALLTGELDFNRPQTKAVTTEMEKAGFRHVTYVELAGASHYTGLTGEALARGLAALDGK
ncbi:MAG TPA: carboxypeptidase regulatory-like domain-containing protein [Thermoanaerobaculia bacterium]|nr:carboxypeptidase regulatory-like domain-containing protein [Thermoanaerobaculia bacterium]